MTGASKPFLDPDVAARVSGLEFRARHVVEGLIVGRHASPFRGHSIEFAQHRPYVAGDDLRHIDWKVWARSDRFSIKQYEEETNLRTTLLLDVSASMAYGEGERQKGRYAAVLAAAFALVLLRQSDSVGLVTFADAIRSEIPGRSQRNHFWTLLAALEAPTISNKTDLGAVLMRVAELQSHRGAMVLLTDLFSNLQGIERGLANLRSRRHDVIVLQVLHDDEIDFPFQGTMRFEGLEAPARVLCDPRSLRANYQAALAAAIDRARRACGQIGVDYRLVRTSEPPAAVLASVLHERESRR